jgi:hypothetical protein
MLTVLSWTASLTIACLLSTLAQPTEAAIMYRWNDSNGRPVISDRPPPPGTPHTTLNSAQYGKSGVRREEPQTPTSNRLEADIPEATNQSSSNNDNATASVRIQKNADLCKHAQDNIYTYENFSRIRTEDPDGTVRFMSSEEIEIKLEGARQIENRHC